MSSEMVRWGGLAGVAAGAMFVLSGILTFIVASPPPQGALGSFGAYLLEVVIVAAFALTLVTIAGVHAAQSPSGRYGLLGAAGSVLTFVGYAMVLVIAHLIRLAGGEPILSVRPVGVVGARRLGSPWSHDPPRKGAAVVVRRAAHLRLPPRRFLGERPCGDREHRVRGCLGVARLRALVAKGHGSRAPSRVS
jgi:hypothetical protein